VDGITNPDQSKATDRSAGFEWLAKAQKFKYFKLLNEQPVHNQQQSPRVSRARAIVTHLKTTAKKISILYVNIGGRWMPRNLYYFFAFTAFVIGKYVCNVIKFNNIRFSHLKSPVLNKNNLIMVQCLLNGVT
jgi:hypothetical protein